MRFITLLAFGVCWLCVAQFAPTSSAQESKSDLLQAQRCRKILDKSVIDFYLPACVDQEFGGYHQELDEGQAFKSGEKFLTLQARQLWFFSTLAAAGIRKEQSLEAASQGYAFIRKHFYDAKWGGYYSKVAREGNVIDSRKHAYLNSFALYALVEYYRATRQT